MSDIKNDQVEYTIHSPPGSKEVNLVFRVTDISNGWLIKAGGRPYFCGDDDALIDAAVDTLERFIAEVRSGKFRARQG